MKNGNGNGNGNGKDSSGVASPKIKFAGAMHVDPTTGRLVIDDLVPASVLLMFFIQKLGKASTEQIAAKVDAAGVEMNPHLLEQGVEALQARQFVSYGKGKTAAGDVVDQWKPRKANFAGMPDVAQVSEHFLSELVATPDAEELISTLNASEEEGAGTKKAKEKLKYADYYGVEITFQTLKGDPNNPDATALGMLLGGHPSSPFYDKIVKKGPACPADCDLRFPRDGQGNPIIPISNIKGWLKHLVRKFSVSPALVDYIGISGGRIEFDGKIDQYAHQIVDLSGQGGGRGITTYEAIAPGARIKFHFNVPKRGGPSFQQFVMWLTTQAPTTPRGLSNARSSENGFVEVVDAKYKGEMTDARTAYASVADIISPEAKAFAEKFLAENRGSFDLRPGRGSEN